MSKAAGLFICLLACLTYVHEEMTSQDIPEFVVAENSIARMFAHLMS